MNAIERVYTQCDICGRDIHFGNAVLEIQRNVERHDYLEQTGLHTATVIDADRLLTSCARCGNRLAYPKGLCKLLMAELELPAQTSDEDVAKQIETGLPETCACCGEELKIGRDRVSLERLIGQMDWNNARQDGELYVIDGEAIISFCSSCGNMMSSLRLQQALQHVVDDQAASKCPEADASSVQHDVHGAAEQPVKILHIAAEGGAITLYGWKDASGEWQFSRETNESALYCEDTADLPLHHFSDVAPGWHGALELLSRYPWYCLHPVYVHPEFAERTMEALYNAPEKHQPDIHFEDWQAVCAGKDPWGELI